jgi:hypothetical protein
MYLRRGDFLGMKMNDWSKWVSGVLTASMIVTGTSWTTATASAATKQFSDVAAGHWAQKHLSKLTMQEILSGYSDGTFRPNVSVSHQEAVIIAIRFMGLEDELDSSGVIITPESLKINDAYKKYLDLAVKKQLLNWDEELEIAAQDPSKEWGKSPASREWLTRLLVRAMGKDSEAKLAAAETTEFPDDARIAASFRGYVNVAVSTGIVKGVAKLVKGVTITEFAPTEDVTRASIATLFSLAQSEVAFSGQVSGVLLAKSANELTLLHDGGSIHKYTLTDDSLIYRYDSNSNATLEQLKLYGKVILINNGNNAIGYVEQTEDTPQIDIYSGTLKSHTASMKRLTVAIGNAEQDFTYDSQYPPIITDLAGNTISIADLPVNMDVKLTVDKVRSANNIVAIEVQQSIINKSGSGTVAAWNPESRELEVSDPATGSRELLTVSANAIIKNAAGANLVLADLKLNDQITFEVKTGLIANIVVTKSVIPPISGVLVGVVKASNSIQYTVNNKLATNFLASSVKVVIEGIPSATLEDIYKGDALNLTVNDQDEVTQIDITNRSVKNMTSATILDYSAKANTLIVNDSNGAKHNFNISTATKFELNGAYLTLVEATTHLSVIGKKISIAYTGDNVVSISLAAKITGTITENSALTRTIKVMLSASESMTLSYTSSYVEIYGKTSINLTDLAVGDVVTVVQNGASNQVSSIQVHKNIQVEVVSVTPVNSRLKFKRSDGITDELTLAATVSLQNELGNIINLNALSVGSLVNLSFQGSSLVKVKAVPASFYGNVSAVNTTLSTLDIVTFANPAVTKALGTNPIIMRDNVVQSSLAAVMPEDRVVIRMDENDRTVVEIITPMKKSVVSVNSSTRTLVTSKVLLTDPNSYTLDSSVYIHQGATTLNLASLKSGDSINLYFVRGKLVEVAKL